MRRALKHIALAALSLLLITAGAIAYLVSTTAGARSLLNLAAAASGIVIQWESLQGTLLDGLDVQGISGSGNGASWTLGQLRVRWQPRLLRDNRLVIDELTASDLAIRLQVTTTSEPMTADMLRSRLFGLPVTVEIAQLRIDTLSFASGDTGFAFDSLSATAQLDNTQLAITSLDYRSEAVTVDGQLQMTEALALSGDLSWQSQQGETAYAGTLDLGGTLQQLDINHAFSTPLQLTTSGTLQPALFANDTLAFDLQHTFPLQPLAVLQRPDTSFAGTLRTVGSAGRGSLDTEVQLAGMVQNYPVALNGRISRRASATLDIDVDASSGSNTLTVLGALGQTLDVEWQVQAPALHELLPMLSGALTGQGRLGGTRELPAVSGTLNGQQLGYEQAGSTVLLDTLDFTANYGPQGNDVQFQLGTLTRTAAGRSTTLLQSANATVTGTPAQHTVSANVVAAPGATQIELTGAWVDQAWTGTLGTARLRSMQYGNWDLQDAVELRYAAQAFSASRHCWDYEELLLCLSGAVNAERRIDAALTLDGVPLSWLNENAVAADKPLALRQWQDGAGAYLPAGVIATGTVDIALTADDFSAPRDGSLDLVLRPQAVELQWSPPDAEQPELLRQQLALTVNSSELHLQQAVWRGAVDVDVAREQQGNFVPQGKLRGEGSLDASDVVNATLVIDFSDLTWVETAVPLLRDTAGSINGLATIAGSRSQPRLQLQMQLAQGRFDIPEYGLQIREVELSMTSAADESVQITGSAMSGVGVVQVDAHVDAPLSSERRVTADLNSTDFLAINTAAARSQLNSDLQLEYNQSGITLNGNVELFSADFDLEMLFQSASQGAVPVSNDVVIVRGAPEDRDVVDQESIPITLDLTVKAGDAVHVHGYDLDATLSGEVSLRQTPGQSLLVYGELGIPQGRYEIYNQQLNAEDGRLMFFGNPANPVLDLRAFRKTASAEVGVWLNGALSEVRGELYSTPALPDSEILSLLVTGKSFGDVDSAENDALLQAVTNFGLRRSQGLTDRVGSTLGLDTFTLGGDDVDGSALGLGKYLTPNLLMRYKVGLFDRQSVLGIEYTLNEHIKLKVESGISQSLELSYTIEKD